YALVFFFQAEDGIRDATVTGVQTCALRISGPRSPTSSPRREVAQVSRGEDVGERVPEGGEARVAIGAGRVGEERRIDFVGALRDGDGSQPREVRLAIVGHGCPGRGSTYSLSLSCTVPNEKFDCNAIMTRVLSSESHMRASAFSAKMPPPLGMRGRTTIAFHF